MNLTALSTALEIALERKKVPMIWGKPGIGKSAAVSQLADSFNVPMLDVRLSQCDPVLLTGVPSVAGRKTLWNTPDRWPTVEKDGAEGILFLDEINQAPPSVTAAAYELIHDKRLGQYTLPSKWRIIAAGNNAEDKAQINRMGTALANRFSHFDVEVCIDAFSAYAYKKKFHPNLISFLQWRPELLHSMDTKKTLKAFPTPRTWEDANDYYQVSPVEMLPTMIASAIGDYATTEFIGYLNIFKTLPTLAQMVANPDSVTVDTYKASVTFALSSLITQSLDVDNSAPLFSIVDRLPLEFQTFIIRSFNDQYPKKVPYIPEITQWLIKHPELFSNED